MISVAFADMPDFMSEKHERLRQARVSAGYKSASAAAEALGISASTYRAHENGQNDFDFMDAGRYAKRFNVSQLWLFEGREASPELTQAAEVLRAQRLARDEAAEAVVRNMPTPNASFPPRYQRFQADRRVPLYGQTEAGPNGKFVMNGAIIADVFCPPGLENVPDAYAVRVYGTSMEPRYKAGETVWLNPQLPVRAGDDVVVQLKPEFDGDEMASYIKEFRSRSSKILKLWQHNPEEGEPKELVFDNDDVFSVHKVVHHATL